MHTHTHTHKTINTRNNKSNHSTCKQQHKRKPQQNNTATNSIAGKCQMPYIHKETTCTCMTNQVDSHKHELINSYYQVKCYYITLFTGALHNRSVKHTDKGREVDIKGQKQGQASLTREGSGGVSTQQQCVMLRCRCVAGAGAAGHLVATTSAHNQHGGAKLKWKENISPLVLEVRNNQTVQKLQTSHSAVHSYKLMYVLWWVFLDNLFFLCFMLLVFLSARFSTVRKQCGPIPQNFRESLPLFTKTGGGEERDQGARRIKHIQYLDRWIQAWWWNILALSLTTCPKQFHHFNKSQG